MAGLRQEPVVQPGILRPAGRVGLRLAVTSGDAIHDRRKGSPRRNFGDWATLHSGKQQSERVDINAHAVAAKKQRLDGCGAAADHRVQHRIARSRVLADQPSRDYRREFSEVAKQAVGGVTERVVAGVRGPLFARHAETVQPEACQFDRATADMRD